MWIIDGKVSYKINNVNTHEIKVMGGEPRHQVWVTKENDKSILIRESENETFINEIKDAIDYAISNNVSSFTITDLTEQIA